MERLSGTVYGIEVRGHLPAVFATYLAPGGDAPLGELELTWRPIDRLPPVAASWETEPAEGEADLRFALFPHPGGFGLAVRGEESGLFRCTPERIGIEWAGDPAGAPHHLVSYALPLWLETRGVPVLHGSAVTVGGRAVGFLGASGVGKSTLAVELVRLGCGFVADDGIALERQGGDWHCLPGPPLARLWPSGLGDRLGVEPETLPRVRGGGDKRRLELSGGGPRPERPRLAGLYLLQRRDGPGEIRLRSPLAPKEALLRLLEHGVAAAPAAALGFSKQRFDRLAEASEAVPMRRLSFPGGEDMAAMILAAVRAAPTIPAPPPPPPRSPSQKSPTQAKRTACQPPAGAKRMVCGCSPQRSGLSQTTPPGAAGASAATRKVTSAASPARPAVTGSGWVNGKLEARVRP